MVELVDMLRTCGLAVLITATLIDPKPFTVLTLMEVQVVLAALVVFIVMFVDHIFGFLLGLALIAIYSRVFMYRYGIRLTGDFTGNSKSVAYVTPQNLVDAQNNVIGGEDNIGKPYSGIAASGYTAQGLPGVTATEKLVPGFPNEPYENIGPFKKDAT